MSSQEDAVGEPWGYLDAGLEKPSHEEILESEGVHSSFGRTTRRRRVQLCAFIFAGCCLSVFWILMNYLPDSHRKFGTTHEISTNVANFDLVKYQAPSPTPSATGVLECFQVYQPVLTSSGATDETVFTDGLENTTTIDPVTSKSSCQVVLMQHDFAFSYGIPFVGNYTPPNCKFNRVTMNFTVTSKGRQFDRLALMYLGDTEVWRTSTAEPTSNGIEWTYVKDMTEYMYFWNSPQKIIFDLGNLVDDTYTGIWNTTLTATFFTSQETVDPASLIIPISARKSSSDSASLFTLPGDNATNTISFPRNANRAVFSVSACGQATEEFWWSNVLQSDISTFEPVDGTLYGYSPFREVQVFIDGQLAGVQWPFPVIFTGGVVPGLWRPIVGIDAFDLREHEIDVTPWLPVLCDGKEHTFEIKVAGIIDDGSGSGTITETVGASWYVTGKIFVWLDEDMKSITTGPKPTILLPAPIINTSSKLTQNSTGANETLEYTTNVKREISISTLIKTQKGTQLSSWTQSLSVTNYGLYTDFGAVQQNNQTTRGVDQSAGGTFYKSTYTYPLYAITTFLVQPSGNFTLDAEVIRGLELGIQGTPVFPTGLQPFAEIPGSASLVSGLSGSQLSTTQNGTAHYFAGGGTSSGFGSTSQVFSFSGLDSSGAVTDTELYYRNVEAVNQTIVKDYESLIGKEFSSYGFPVAAVPKAQVVLGNFSPKEAIGRGPGYPKQPLVQGGGS